ncbi:MAG: DUF4139 domain-containing protein [Geminicoccaceae bacterium]|nr:DUF4139 domain-containing protein [Geminicoccaceae bacterium]
MPLPFRFAFLLLLPLAAHADEIRLDAPVRAVTVYLEGADVTRRGGVRVGPGRHTVVVGGLPAGVGAEDLRVGVDGGFGLGGVRVARAFGAIPSGTARRLEGEIRAIEAEMRGHRDDAEAQRVKLDAVRATGGHIGEGGDATPEDWRAGWEVLVEGAEAALSGIRAATAPLDGLQRALEAKRRELESLGGGDREASEARIDLVAGAAGEARFTLGYAVGDAGWEPLYEANVDAAAGRLTLSADATVRQGTGEPWEEVDLTLAGTRPERPTDLPPVEPWRIDVAPPVVAEARMASPMMAADAGLAKAGIAATPLVTRFVVDEPVTVPEDGSGRRVGLAAIEAPFALKARVIPALSLDAVLTAGVTNATGALWPAGALRVVRDGASAARGRLDPFRPGEARDLPLGVDERIEVERRLEGSRKGEDGFFDKERRVVRRYATTITNRHDVPVGLRVLDRIPVPVDERIGVDLLDDTTPPDETDADGKEGVLAWNLTLAPGETRTLGLAYAVTFPVGVEVEGL